MKTHRLKCPSCGERYPLSRLVRETGWAMRCPSCGARLSFSTRSVQRVGAIAGLTFAVLILVVGPRRIMAWPAFAWFMLFALVYGRMLTLFLGSLDVARREGSFDPFPNQTGVFKILCIVSAIGAGILALTRSLWVHITPWGTRTLSTLMVAFCLFLLIATGRNLLGKNGIFRRQEKPEEPVGEVSSDGAPSDRQGC